MQRPKKNAEASLRLGAYPQFSLATPCALYREESSQAQTLWPAPQFCVGGGIWEAASGLHLGPFLTSEVEEKALATCRNLQLSRALSPQVSEPPFLAHVVAAPEETITIATLLKGGWQIAGYTSTLDSRSAFILFRHPEETYLVQCRASYDVTRTPPVTSNCYKLQ